MKEEKWIAFDFDGVICKYDGWKGFDKFGKPNQVIIDVIDKLHKKGFKISIFTTRQFTPKINKWLNKNNIYYDKFNDSIDSKDYFMNGKKIYANCYIDDRAVHYNQGNGDSVDDIVEKVVNVVFQYDFD